MRLHLADPVAEYIAALVDATRRPEAYSSDLKQWLRWGVSPRAAIAMERGARAVAWLDGRDYVSPDDVQTVAGDALRHRLLLDYGAQARGITAQACVDELLRKVSCAVKLPALEELLTLRAAARTLSLRAQGPARALLLGSHRSAHHGRGLEIEEVRPYVAGDDPRSIDWRVTARRGRVHTKLFREERERPVWLLVDLGASMFFGSKLQLKSMAAVRAAALLGVGRGARRRSGRRRHQQRTK